MIRIPESRQSYQDGLARVHIYTVHPDSLSSFDYRRQHYYCGLIDAKGKIVFSHPKLKKITPFESGHAFGLTTEDNWILINEKGKRVSKENYLEVPIDGFRNGRAFVNTDKGYGLINTDGKFVRGPLALDMNEYKCQDQMVFFYKEIKGAKKYERLWGFWDLQSGHLQDARFHDINQKNLFNKHLLQVVEDDRMGYVSLNGKYVWRARKEKKRTDKSGSSSILSGQR